MENNMGRDNRKKEKELLFILIIILTLAKRISIKQLKEINTW